MADPSLPNSSHNPYPQRNQKMSSFRDLPGAVFKTETQLEVTAVLANCGANIGLAAQAIRLWIEAKQRKGRAEADIIKKVDDMERKYVWDASIHEAFHSARASTGLPRSTILPASRRVREAEERERGQPGSPSSPVSPIAGPSGTSGGARLSPVSTRSPVSPQPPASPPAGPPPTTSRGSIMRRSPSNSRTAVQTTPPSRSPQIPPPPVIRNSLLPSLRAERHNHAQAQAQAQAQAAAAATAAAAQAPGTPKSFLSSASSNPGLSISASLTSSSVANSPPFPASYSYSQAAEPDVYASSRGPPSAGSRGRSQLPYLHPHPPAADSTDTLRTRRWSQGSYSTVTSDGQTISDRSEFTGSSYDDDDQATISDRSIATFSDASVSTGDDDEDVVEEEEGEDAPMPLSNLMRVSAPGQAPGNPYVTMGARGFALTRMGRSGLGRRREGWEEPGNVVANRSVGEISQASGRTNGSSSGSGSDPDWRAAVDSLYSSFPDVPRNPTSANAHASPAETVRGSPASPARPGPQQNGAARPDTPFHLPPAALDLRTPSALTPAPPTNSAPTNPTPTSATPTAASLGHQHHSFGPRPRPGSAGAASLAARTSPVVPLSPVRLLPAPSTTTAPTAPPLRPESQSSSGSDWSQASAERRPLPMPRHQFSTDSMASATSVGEGGETVPPPAYSAVDPRLLEALGV